jgi:hypothetical protein
LGNAPDVIKFSKAVSTSGGITGIPWSGPRSLPLFSSLVKNAGLLHGLRAQHCNEGIELGVIDSSAPSPPASVFSDRERLEAYAKGELLDAMTRKLGGVDAEVATAPGGPAERCWIDVERGVLVTLKTSRPKLSTTRMPSEETLLMAWINNRCQDGSVDTSRLIVTDLKCRILSQTGGCI